MPIPESEVKELLKKYQQRLTSQVKASAKTLETKPITSKEYQEFKRQYMPRQYSLYEQLCNFSEKIVKISPDKKRLPVMQEAIAMTHLNVTPTGVVSFSIIAPILLVLLGVLFSLALVGVSVFFILFFLVFGVSMIVPIARIPEFAAARWRLKASNQMVLCIFYVVTYMRHTSNLERAVDFAADHLSPPLALDLKRILWEVETEKFENVKEALEDYLINWKKSNMEFVESFHLIEGSLLEPSEDRRVELLDKGLSVMLDETYEKMLHYAQNLKSPITMLHMLGVIMPILGLVILPLVVSFIETAKWYHIAMLYNVALPIAVYYLGKNILARRPTGYGETDISELPEFQRYKSVRIKIGGSEIALSPMYFALSLGIILFFIGMLPLILHLLNPDPLFDITFLSGKVSLLGYRTSAADSAVVVGPYGLGAALVSLGVTLALGLGIGYYYRLTSQNVIKIRETTKQLEKEFASALFQLGNRLSDGLPAEIAFDKVAAVMENSVSGNFFRLVSMNIRRLGLGIEEAIFHPSVGAIRSFPSNVVESSMKVLIESSRKGPRIAAVAVINVSRYIQEIHKVNERLKDLLADIIASMQSQISFLTPVIAGIVIGITSMVTTIIGQLRLQLEKVASAPGAGAGAPTGLLSLFGDGIPTFHFQLIVGIYVVQIVYILTILSNGIENGEDRLNEKYLLGRNMIRSTLLYCFVSAVIMIIFNFIALSILGGIQTTGQ